MRGSTVDEQGALPWDPIWEYVLGEDGESHRAPLLPKKKKASADSGGFLDRLIPEAESFDDSSHSGTPKIKIRSKKKDNQRRGDSSSFLEYLAGGRASEETKPTESKTKKRNKKEKEKEDGVSNSYLELLIPGIDSRDEPNPSDSRKISLHPKQNERDADGDSSSFLEYLSMGRDSRHESQSRFSHKAEEEEKSCHQGRPNKVPVPRKARNAQPSSETDPPFHQARGRERKRHPRKNEENDRPRSLKRDENQKANQWRTWMESGRDNEERLAHRSRQEKHKMRRRYFWGRRRRQIEHEKDRQKQESSTQSDLHGIDAESVPESPAVSASSVGVENSDHLDNSFNVHKDIKNENIRDQDSLPSVALDGVFGVNPLHLFYGSKGDGSEEEEEEEGEEGEKARMSSSVEKPSALRKGRFSSFKRSSRKSMGRKIFLSQHRQSQRRRSTQSESSRKVSFQEMPDLQTYQQEMRNSSYYHAEGLMSSLESFLDPWAGESFSSEESTYESSGDGDSTLESSQMTEEASTITHDESTAASEVSPTTPKINEVRLTYLPSSLPDARSLPEVDEDGHTETSRDASSSATTSSTAGGRISHLLSSKVFEALSLTDLDEETPSEGSGSEFVENNDSSDYRLESEVADAFSQPDIACQSNKSEIYDLNAAMISQAHDCPDELESYSNTQSFESRKNCGRGSLAWWKPNISSRNHLSGESASTTNDQTESSSAQVKIEPPRVPGPIVEPLSKERSQISNEPSKADPPACVSATSLACWGNKTRSGRQLRTCNEIESSGFHDSLASSEDKSSLEMRQTKRFGALACLNPSRNLSDKQLAFGIKDGKSFNELSSEELSQIFPKLRTVVDEKAEVVGNSYSFDNSILPAHLQTHSIRRGKPHSLFEYEYETGRHMYVGYSSFGECPRSLVSLRAASVPDVGRSGGQSLLVQVEASTVSETDCYIRQGLWWGEEKVPLPNIPGVDFAGKVCRIDKKSSERYNLKTGDRVVSLCKWGGNARYLSVDPSRMVKVPEDIDPAAAVCLVETYLSAFQLLHRSEIKNKRYRKGSLKGKTFLILGPVDANMARALAELSDYADAEYLYASTKQKYFHQLESVGIIPLDKEKLDWFERLKGRVDCIISFEQDVSTPQYQLLTEGGEIVLVSCGDLKVDAEPRGIRSDRVICKTRKVRQQNRTFVFDLYTEWETNKDLALKDLEHLVQLLSQENISPHILDRIPLGKVARAQDMIQTKRLTGFLVCEPWLVSKTRAIRL